MVHIPADLYPNPDDRLPESICSPYGPQGEFVEVAFVRRHPMTEDERAAFRRRLIAAYNATDGCSTGLLEAVRPGEIAAALEYRRV